MQQIKGGLTKLHQQRSIDTHPVDTQLGAPAAKNGGSDSEAAAGPFFGGCAGQQCSKKTFWFVISGGFIGVSHQNMEI